MNKRSDAGVEAKRLDASSIAGYVSRYDKGRYARVDDALLSLFEAYPDNSSFPEVLAKVCVANSFYATNLRIMPLEKGTEMRMPDAISMSKHICAQSRFDKWIRSTALDDRMRAVEYIRNGNSEFIRRPDAYSTYSFATKYCSWHNPAGFPIVDTYSRSAIVRLAHVWGFAKSLRKNDTANYDTFVWLCDEAIRHAKQELGFRFNDYRQLDKFLWMFGKEYGLVM